MPDHILAGKIAGLRAEVGRRLSGRYGDCQKTASIGAVPVDGTIRDYKKLYRYADAALYISKYRGKDCFYINNEMTDRNLFDGAGENPYNVTETAGRLNDLCKYYRPGKRK